MERTESRPSSQGPAADHSPEPAPAAWPPENTGGASRAATLTGEACIYVCSECRLLHFSTCPHTWYKIHTYQETSLWHHWPISSGNNILHMCARIISIMDTPTPQQKPLIVENWPVCSADAQILIKLEFDINSAFLVIVLRNIKLFWRMSWFSCVSMFF